MDSEAPSTMKTSEWGEESCTPKYFPDFCSLNPLALTIYPIFNQALAVPLWGKDQQIIRTVWFSLSQGCSPRGANHAPLGVLLIYPRSVVLLLPQNALK